MSRDATPRRTRRQVLRGAGGFTLGLPFLPSLLPRQAAAADRPRRFICIGTQHGGITGTNMAPPAAMLDRRTEIYPGHTIAHGTLARQLEGATAVLSPVLRAPAARLTDRLVSRMNVLRGMDITFYIAHHGGGHLGNFAATSGGTAVKTLIPTIDHIMAYSPSFYRTLDGIRDRSICTGGSGGMSWGYSNPTSRTGTVQEQRRTTDARELFDKMVGVTQPTTPAQATRKPIVDLVIEDYRRLRASNRRLSPADKQRLDDHMARLFDVQRRLTARSVSCGDLPRPAAGSSSADARAYHQALNDVIVAAFVCGTARIATMNIGSTFVSYSGDWHQEVAHKHLAAEPQRLLVQGLQQTFEHVFVDLAAKLDVPEGDGTTLLDNTLLMWSQESGPWTHNSQGLTVVTAGSAGGFFKTGQAIDYRNQVKAAELKMTDSTVPYEQKYEFAGLVYRQWLGALLQSMGVPRSEYETADAPGYGDPYMASSFTNKYGAHLADIGNVPPLLRLS